MWAYCLYFCEHANPCIPELSGFPDMNSLFFHTTARLWNNITSPVKNKWLFSRGAGDREVLAMHAQRGQTQHRLPGPSPGCSQTTQRTFPFKFSPSGYSKTRLLWVWALQLSTVVAGNHNTWVQIQVYLGFRGTWIFSSSS